MMLGYMGPSGTFTHQAALNYAGESGVELKEFPTIYSVLMAVNDGIIEEGIVPIENSIEGGVNQTLDCLAFDADLYIVKEQVLRITQNLLVKKGAKKEAIQTIASHPQAIGQCSRLLNDKFKNCHINFTDSTSAAAVLTAEGDGSTACIGSESSADLYGLDILFSNCGDKNNNSTRFIIVSKKPSREVTSHDKTSIAFALENKPGSLFKALERFAADGINMVKIESRPLKEKLGTYVFFIDIEGNIDDPIIYFALEAVKRNTFFYKFLGSYNYE